MNIIIWTEPFISFKVLPVSFDLLDSELKNESGPLKGTGPLDETGPLY